ncbi:MAG: hypothetical protein ACUVXH_10580 [Anaerolineae bacterium]
MPGPLRLSDQDILFMVQTLMPHRTDHARVVEAIRDDRAYLEAMLDDERLFQQVMGDEEILIKISPRLFFHILLRRALRDLRELTHTVEVRNLQKVAVFDADQVVNLLERPEVRDYLADMLASFTRIESVTVPVRVRRGVWRKVRFSDFDLDSLEHYAQSVEGALRFGPYKRIADVCLFLVGMFPEYIEAQYRYPLSKVPRRGILGRPRSLEDYEEEGRQFYTLAAEHEAAHALNLRDVLITLAERFTLAEKPLMHLSRRYLGLSRHRLFGLEA